MIMRIGIVCRTMQIFNASILFTGFVLFALGLKTTLNWSFMKLMFGRSLYVISSALLIFGGVLVISIATLGAVATHKRSRSLLFIYSTLIASLLIIITLGGGLSYSLRNEVRVAHLLFSDIVPQDDWIDHRMHRQLISTIAAYGNHTGITDAWDSVQQSFHCCGIAWDKEPGYVWYHRLNRSFRPPSRRLVPPSCCRAPSRNEPAINRCMFDPSNSTYTFHADCYKPMKASMIDHARTVRAIALCIVCIFVVAMLIAMSLFYMLG